MMCIPVLEIELTRLLDKQGANLFDILNPEVPPWDECVLFDFLFLSDACKISTIIQFLDITSLFVFLHSVGLCGDSVDFGFPHHLLVEFL